MREKNDILIIQATEYQAKTRGHSHFNGSLILIEYQNIRFFSTLRIPTKHVKTNFEAISAILCFFFKADDFSEPVTAEQTDMQWTCFCFVSGRVVYPHPTQQQLQTTAPQTQHGKIISNTIFKY